MNNPNTPELYHLDPEMPISEMLAKYDGTGLEEVDAQILSDGFEAYENTGEVKLLGDALEKVYGFHELDQAEINPEDLVADAVKAVRMRTTLEHFDSIVLSVKEVWFAEHIGEEPPTDLDEKYADNFDDIVSDPRFHSSENDPAKAYVLAQEEFRQMARDIALEFALEGDPSILSWMLLAEMVHADKLGTEPMPTELPEAFKE